MVCNSSYTLYHGGSGSFCGEVRIVKGVRNLEASRTVLERQVVEGENPVCESGKTPRNHPSSVGHVKPGVNQGGPPPKAKYSLVTDSEEVRRLKNEKNPVEGSEIEPETRHLQAVGAL